MAAASASKVVFEVRTIIVPPFGMASREFENEVEQRAFDLASIGQGFRKVLRVFHFQGDCLSQRVPKHVKQAADKAIEVDGYDRQGLLA